MRPPLARLGFGQRGHTARAARLSFTHAVHEIQLASFRTCPSKSKTQHQPKLWPSFCVDGPSPLPLCLSAVLCMQIDRTPHFGGVVIRRLLGWRQPPRTWCKSAEQLSRGTHFSRNCTLQMSDRHVSLVGDAGGLPGTFNCAGFLGEQWCMGNNGEQRRLRFDWVPCAAMHVTWVGGGGGRVVQDRFPDPTTGGKGV